ncbi:hypothetical protein SELMODRAFT_104155 [Selaginella moellendorffii]|uniref:BPL/LPL catalytic domain-containing protein n=2 Tax=Selaginella moellendorffii TaxID=88036 RepID=D8RXV4_SELML|nr:hypothetical protein SELMODRAFT_104155 [Selaginella moellendorffii]
MRPAMRVLRLQGFPIFRQLQLEERLMHKSDENWCVFNNGTSPPTIVMGVSGSPEELLDVDAVSRDGIPVVRRFSGGGTVIVDEDTLFVTLICSRKAIPSLELFPRTILKWTGELYKNVFLDNPDFTVHEQDYAFGQTKIAGNAESISKDRWLHHTSFLWDYSPARMAYLTIPRRAPAYRLGRSHGDFICKLKDYLSYREELAELLEDALGRHFCLERTRLEDVDEEEYKHRTRFVELLRSPI